MCSCRGTRFSGDVIQSIIVVSYFHSNNLSNWQSGHNPVSLDTRLRFKEGVRFSPESDIYIFVFHARHSSFSIMLVDLYLNSVKKSSVTTIVF